MSDCEKYLELISASLDGALTGAERAELDEHLASCPSCRALREDLTALRDGCAGWGEEDPPEGFAARVAAAAAAGGAPKKVLFLRRYRSLLATAAVAAVVLLAVRTDGFSSLMGARSGAPAADAEVKAALTSGASGQNADAASGAPMQAPVPEPSSDTASNDSTERSADGEKTVTGGELPAENGSGMTFGSSLYASAPPDACEAALCGGALTLPDLPEGEWAWILVLTGGEPEWPVDVTPVAAAEEAAARYFSAGADDRAALEEAFAGRGCVSCTDAVTVSGAEKGLICLLAD